MKTAEPPSASVNLDGNQFAATDVSDLRVGATLQFPIFDDRKRSEEPLLTAGTTITTSLLTRIQKRGVSRIRVHRSEFLRVTFKAAPELQQHAKVDARVKKPEPEPELESTSEPVESHQWVRSSESFFNKVQQHGTTVYNAAQISRFNCSFQKTAGEVELLFDGLDKGDISNAVQMAQFSIESLIEITQDLDLFVAMGLQPVGDKYPSKHSMQTAMLAISIGTILGLKTSELIELGIGCLVHDAGMLRVRPDLVASERALDQIEFLEITKHPAATFDMMREVKDTPLGSRMVAYQMHERCDGSGYPRQRNASQIHPLAKIAAVADVFVAMISPRPYRPAMLPYHAMEQVIHETREGLFDPTVVRGLLHTVSLFPIGSLVEISDGRMGTVLRATGESFAQPIIKVWKPGQTESDSEVINLREEIGVKVIRPLSEFPSPVATTA